MGEFALGRIPAMRHQVDLGEARHLDRPVVGFDGDLVFQQRARLGASIATVLQARLALPQPAIDLSRADPQELLFHLGF